MKSDMMSEKPDLAASAQPAIAPEEYDFSDVLRSELLACLLYEYARESRAALREIAAERKHRKQAKGKTRSVKFGPRVQNGIQSHILMSSSLCSGFPNTPWQCLSDKDKQLLLKYIAIIPQLLRYFATFDKPPVTFALNEPGTMTLDAWKQQYRERCKGVSENEPIKFGFSLSIWNTVTQF